MYEQVLDIENFLGVAQFVPSTIGKAYNTQSFLGWRHDIDSRNYSNTHSDIHEYHSPPEVLCETLAPVYVYINELSSSGLLPPIPESWGCRQYWDAS